MSTKTAVMVTAAVTAALVLAGAALAVALTRDGTTRTHRVCTGSAYFCAGQSSYAR